jgi:hypothetical protein
MTLTAVGWTVTGRVQKVKMRDASVDELGLQAAAGSPSA